MTATITSLVPATEPRLVRPEVVATRLGWEIGIQRMERTAVEVARAFFAKYSIDVDDDTFEVFMHDVGESIRADRVYDSEMRQAERACSTAVREWIAGPRTGMVQATGWFRGERLQVGREQFLLTGSACERCKVNPEAYGLGGGVRCVDTTGCGYWYCA